MSGMEAPSPPPGHLDFGQEADVKSCYGQYECELLSNQHQRKDPGEGGGGGGG